MQTKESGTEIGNSLGIRFRRPTSAQLSRAVKADEISVVEPTQPLRLARQSKTIERLGLLSQPLLMIYSSSSSSESSSSSSSSLNSTSSPKSSGTISLISAS